MELFHKKLNEIAEKIRYFEVRRKKIGELLRKINDEMKVMDEEILDEKIIQKVPERKFKRMKILGVDGGIVKHSYHGLDLILMRAVGVNFTYEEEKLKTTDYFPSSNPLPIPRIIFDVLSDIELNSCYNFERQILEVMTMIRSIKKFKPDIALLDGSIIPHYIPKPENPILADYYEDLIEVYRSLFRVAEEERIILAGVVEDSRGRKFCDILTRKILSRLTGEFVPEMKLILEKTRDTNLLFYALEKGERTFAFNYSRNPKVHPILREFEKMSDKFCSFYIKTVEFDRPLRVDFLNLDIEDLIEKLSIALIQTSGHAGYGLPAVLIEADQRAKLSEKDLEMFYSDLISKLGNVATLFKMRRELRPF